MSFDRCFQENHVGDLKKLASRIEQCRKDFPQAVVNLELIRAAAAMETILRPVQVLTLIEFAGCEIAGSLAITEECRECQGCGENFRYVQDDPEDMSTVRDVWERCWKCNGTGKVLSAEAKRDFGLFDARARIAARRDCNLSYRGLYFVLHGKRIRDKPKRQMMTHHVPF